MYFCDNTLAGYLTGSGKEKNTPRHQIQRNIAHRERIQMADKEVKINNEIEASSGKAKKGGRDNQGKDFTSQVKLNRSFGTDLKSAIEAFGESAVFDFFHAQAVIKCQAAVRGKMEATDEAGAYVNDDASCIEAGEAYVPGVTTRRVGTGAQSKLKKLEAMIFSDATKEEIKDEFLRH